MQLLHQLVEAVDIRLANLYPCVHTRSQLTSLPHEVLSTQLVDQVQEVKCLSVVGAAVGLLPARLVWGSRGWYWRSCCVTQKGSHTPG